MWAYVRRSPRIAVALLLLFVAFTPVLAHAQTGPDPFVTMGLSQAQLICTNSVNTDPWAAGIASAQPGRWWNPKRYGTGWDLVYNDDRTKLKAFMYTFNAVGHSTWLATDMKSIDTSGDYWTAPLLEYTQDAAGTITSNPVGRVMFRFFRDDPSRIAMRWTWNEAATAGAIPANPGYIEECLNDMTRLNPTYYTGVSSVPETKALYGSSKTVLEPAVSQVFSGYWSDAYPAAVDEVPGVVMTVMQTSLGPYEGQFGEAAVRLMFNQRGPVPRKPIFVQAQRENLRTTLPLTEDTFKLYFHYGIGYSGYPVTDCPGSTGCNNNIEVGTYTRTFLAAYGYRRAEVKFLIDHNKLGGSGEVPGAPVTASPAYLLGVPVSGNPLTSQTITKTVSRTTKLQDISVNRYVCAAPANGTCDVWVSWAGNAIGKPWKRDLGTLTYDAAPLDTGDFGTASVQLHVGDRVQFELWSGQPGTAGANLLDRTPEVRGVAVGSASQGAIELPSAPQISNQEDLPPQHDPTIGALAGSSDVSGGAATYTVPIQIPPGRAGMQPAVSLSYNSGAGNGVAGLGWNLNVGSSIHRCPQTRAQDGAPRGVQLDSGDRLCLDGQRLLLAPGSNTYGAVNAVYRTEIESFAKIVQTGAALGSGDVCFTVQQKDGRTLTYGCAPAGHTCAGAIAPRVRPSGQGAAKELSWLLSRVEDSAHNTMDFCYAQGADASEVLLDRIYYTGSTIAALPTEAKTASRRIEFAYESRPFDGRANDSGSSSIAGGTMLQTRRLTTISTFSPDSLLPARRYKLDYKDTAVSQLDHSYYSGRSLLRRIKECAYEANGTERCLSPTEFGWSDGSWEFTSRKLTATSGPTSSLAPPPPPLWAEGPEQATPPEYRRTKVLPIGDLDGDGTRETLVKTNWYDGQNWHEQSQLSKITADREAKGSVMLGEFAPSDAVDIDGDGIAELLNAGKFYKWTRGRGATLCDGGATSCTASASSYFQQVSTNLPAGPFDVVQSTADFNGDGAPDVLIRMGAGSVCDFGGGGGSGSKVDPPSGVAPLCLYLNTRPGPIVAGTTTFNFAAPLQIDTVSTVSDDGVQHIADIDGNGVADVVLANRNGILRILFGQIAGNSVTFNAAAPASLGLRSYTKNLRWMDINADGLDDVVIADVPSTNASCDTNNNCFAVWVLQINKGGSFAAETYPAAPPGTLSPGLSISRRAGSQWQLRYFSKMIQTDVDSDGRPDLLYPAHFAARMCFGARLTPGLCLVAPRPEDCSNGICDANVCAAPPPEDGSAYVAHPNVSSKFCAADAFKSGLGDVDPSVYKYNAIRFVQTGANTFRLQVDETSIIAGASHLGNQRGRADDYFGDGLPDIVADAGCPLRPTTNFPNNTCELSAGGNYGPGSATSYLDAAQTIQLGQLVDPAAANLVINENLGDGARPGSSPTFPDLMSTAINALNDRTQWIYHPLSSAAFRTDDFPLYQIDTGYVDAQHFLFRSSMPVVSAIGRSSASSGGTAGLHTSGARSLRYSYSGAMYNSAGRGFQGFRTVGSEILSANDRVLRTLTTFHQKFPLTGRVQIAETRLPNVSGTLGRLTYETFDWQCDLNNRYAGCPGQDGNPLPANTGYWPYLNSSAKRQYDLVAAQTGGPQFTTSTSITTNADPMSAVSGWSLYGNLTRQEVAIKDGLGSASGDKFNLQQHVTTTVNEYDTSPGVVGQWWLDKLLNSAKTTSVSYLPRSNGTPAGIDLSTKELRTVYDWNADRSPNWNEISEPSSGMLLRTEYGYPTSSVGLPTSARITGSGIDEPRETRTVYSSDLYFPNSVTSVLSATTPSLNHTASTAARASDGQPKWAIDPNGLKVVMNYDAFGRPVERFSYRTNQTSLLAPPSYTWLARCNPCNGTEESFASYYQTTVADGSPSTRIWFDILGREVKRATRTFDGRWSNVTTKYDNMGTVQQSSAPFFTGETPLYTLFTYDRLNRVLTKRAPTAELNPAQGDTLTSYAYVGLRTDITVSPISGNCAIANLCFSMSRQTNALGQLMRTTDALAGITDYWMDPLGKAAALRDAKLNTTRASYNAFGHRLNSSDPNQGNWSFTYNALGEPKTQTDARGVLTSVTQRDALGRVLKQRREPTLGVPVSLTDEKTLDTWQYDPSGAKGQLAQVKRQRASASLGGNPDTAPVSWQESYGYFADTTLMHTRTTTIERAAPGPLVLTNEYQYDQNYGNLIGITYPYPYSGTSQPLTVWRRYNRYGMLASLTDARLMTPMWSLWETDAYGKATKEQFGYALFGYASYSRSTGQMKSQHWVPFDRPTFTEKYDQLTYTYDLLGNLTAQNRKWLRYESNTNITLRVGLDRVGESNETYGYDKLQRLTSSDAQVRAWNGGNWTLLPASKPHYDYQYDPVGNITSKSYFADLYAYGDTSVPVGSGGHCGPNAMAQATSGALPEGLVRSYVCDANGNQIGETGNGQNVETRNLVFDGANLPTRISHNDNWDGSFNAPNVTAFAYGPTNDRYFRSERTGQPGSESEAQQAYYGADGFEYEVSNGSSFVYRVELGPVVYTRKSSGSTVSPSETAYELRDRLGSTIAAADRWGHFNGTVPNNYTMEGRLRRSYDAFGSPRNVDLSHVSGPLPPQLPSLQLDPTSRRGFTEHEHLDRVRLIHMNGRVYDYRSGRFLSVDPLVQAPANSQSLNSYSYIMNNPLSGVDPTGYQSECAVTEEKSCTLTITDSRSANKLGERVTYTMDDDGNVRAYSSDGGAVSISTLISSGADTQQDHTSASGGKKNESATDSIGAISKRPDIQAAACLGSCHGTDGDPMSHAQRAQNDRSTDAMDHFSSLNPLTSELSSLYELIVGKTYFAENEASRPWAAVGVLTWGYGKYGKYGKELPAVVPKIAGLFIKPISLPAWRRISIDMEHIASGHMARGSRVSPQKTLFPEGWSAGQVENAVRQAYRYGQRVTAQGERVLVRGEYSGIRIEMWVNTETRVIETAYTIGR